MRPRLDFGRAIETLRAARGLSRQEVAGLARVSYSHLAKIERGLKRPSTDVAARIARTLGLRGSEFLKYVEELSAPAPDEESPTKAVQLPLQRGKALPLFGGEPETRAPGRGRRRGVDPEAPTNLVVNELLVIARRLRPEDRQALLQLARHLLRRA